ncbi:MAG: hypothetical protein ACHQ03_11935 [Candidatus Bathyarchaeia archaeon]
MCEVPFLVGLRRTIDLLIYLSVVVGVVLLPQLFMLVPTWLFFSVLIGWLAYVAVAVLAAVGRRIAYPLAFVLSILTLGVSLPQPEHYSYVAAGLSLASTTFIVGSVLQVVLLVLIPIYLYSTRTRVKQS